MTKYMKIDDGPPVPYEPTVQLDIHGNSQPLTWDGQPLYSPSTVAESLFDPDAFEQMPGQLAMRTPQPILTPGTRVIRGKYHGRIVREYIPGMYEVRLASGMIVVPREELRLAADEL